MTTKTIADTMRDNFVDCMGLFINKLDSHTIALEFIMEAYDNSDIGRRLMVLQEVVTRFDEHRDRN